MSDTPIILVVDDDKSARDTLAALLAAERYALLFANHGKEALATLAETPVDLVLCDVMMPGLDGFEVCRAMKAHPDWRFIPVILVTALDGQDDMVRGLDVGADEFLTKPVDKIVLRSRVRVMLRIRAQYGAARQSAGDLASLLKARREDLVAAAGLTAREAEVLELLLLGRTQADIGVVLGISPRTAKFHQTNALAKLGAESRADLLRLLS